MAILILIKMVKLKIINKIKIGHIKPGFKIIQSAKPYYSVWETLLCHHLFVVNLLSHKL